MVEPTTTAALIAGGASILSGAMGGGMSGAKSKRLMRYQYQSYQKYGEPVRRGGAKFNASLAARESRKMQKFQLKRIYGKQLQTRVRDAKRAGLHPLFALGSSGYAPPATSSPGQSPKMASLPGQSPQGGFDTSALTALVQHFARTAEINAQANLIDSQRQNSAVAVAKNNISNDTAGAVVDKMREQNPAITHKVIMDDGGADDIIELKPDEQGTHIKGNRGVSPAFLVAKKKMYFGPQEDAWVWIPNVKDMDALLEEPLVIGIIIASMNVGLGLERTKKLLKRKGLQIGKEITQMSAQYRKGLNQRIRAHSRRLGIPDIRRQRYVR